MPGSAPDHPETEQKIRNGMSGHRVAKPFFPAHQSLIGKTAEDSCEPFMMRESKNRRCGQKRRPAKLTHRQRLEVRLRDVAIQKRTIENLLHRRYHNRRAKNTNDDERPGEGRILAERCVRIPFSAARPQFWI